MILKGHTQYTKPPLLRGLILGLELEHDLSLLVEGTCHRTEARPFFPLILLKVQNINKELLFQPRF
jgi:hypothetical protein